MNPLRIAVIGAGHLGTIHTRLLCENEQVELAGVVDPIKNTRERITSDFGVRSFSSLEPILERIDAAIVATPTVQHEQVAETLIRHNKHAFIEKPITQSTEQAERLIALAAQQDVVLQVGHVEQFNPTWSAAKPWLQDPRMIESHRCGNFSFRSIDISIVLDLMIHDIELILSVVRSPVQEIRASGISQLTSTEDVAVAWITFSNGCTASMHVSRLHPTPKREMTIVSNRHQLVLDFVKQSLSLQGVHQKFGDRNPQVDQWSHRDLNNYKSELKSEFFPVQSVDVDSDVNAIAQEHLDFVQAIRTGRQPCVDGTRGRDALELAERIIEEIRGPSSQPVLRAA